MAKSKISKSSGNLELIDDKIRRLLKASPEDEEERKNLQFELQVVKVATTLEAVRNKIDEKDWGSAFNEEETKETEDDI